MSKSISPDTIIGHYRVISQIGAGGMGEVYLAQDTKLDRKVAIKFLHEEFSKDADKLNRFVQEAKAASALNHPNILTVYEIGEVDGKNYIATELIDGKTLRDHLSHKESLQLNQILKIGVQVSEALAAAHQAGIVHRDIKPENIMLRKDGYAKVLDFGLAKLTEKKTTDEVSMEGPTRVFVNTTPGMVMGTVSYMSPEQARGKETDARTDIWSLGVVLYEMLAGKVPFTGETVNHAIVSILEKEPLHLDNLPSELQRIVRKSLTKDVEMRYQSAHDLLIDLKNLRRDLDIQGELERSFIPNRETANASLEGATQVYTTDPVATTRSGQTAATQNITTSSSSLEYAVTQAKSHKFATAIIGVLLVAVISGVGYFAFVSRGGSTKELSSIAVMPLENRSGNADSEYLSDGLTESLIYRLSQLPNLKVSPANSVFRYKGKDSDVKTIASELSVNAVMVGRMSQRGDDLSISVELIDAANNKLLWGEQYDRKSSDLLVTQREIAAAIVQKLQVKFSGSEGNLTKTYTDNNEAYQLYYSTGHKWYANYLEDSGRPDESLKEFRRAQELDPLSLIITENLADRYLQLGDLDSAYTQGMKVIDLDPNYAGVHRTLSLIYLKRGQHKEALTAAQKSVELSERSAIYLSTLGFVYAQAGNSKEAFTLIKELEEKYSRQQANGHHVAAIFAGLGDKDSAFVWLEKDFRTRSSTLVAWINFTTFESLRGDPRMLDLRRRMGLPQ